MTIPVSIHGLLAEFATAESLLAAARSAREAGYRRMDAYTPYPVEGMETALALPPTRIPFVVFVGGVVGASVGFFMQFWSMGVDYRFNSGGRPYLSWPVFIPITFEVMILVAALSAALSMFFLNGLPSPYHPLFNVPRFARASQDLFFLCIEASDPHFDRFQTATLLSGLAGCVEVWEVPLDPLQQAPSESPSTEVATLVTASAPAASSEGTP